MARPTGSSFSLVISDAYSGITLIDGQPTMPGLGYENFKRITTNFQHTIPENAKLRIPLRPPAGMSRQDFARKLMEKAQNFTSYVSPYSAPKHVHGSRMRPGEYNSSSYIAGLL
ncbi:hypothetical protein WKW79_02085 [Variovorax robiniae]|uniref:Uncharacterized protein n=1 Tax=Variovorax robiniae TaxID=1836199 RepID=A0ABU8X0J7_9BURK